MKRGAALEPAPQRGPGPAGTPHPVAPVSVPEWATRLARLLDSALPIPGTDIRIGLDPILGVLLPELGDALGAVLSLTLLGVAWKERVPGVVLGRMLINLLLDALVGAVPVVGDLFDFAFRANEKNLALIERHRQAPDQKPTWGDRVVVALVMLAALAVLVLPLLVGLLLLAWLSRAFGGT